MTQSHLPRTGRGVFEAVTCCCVFYDTESCLPFKEKQAFLFLNAFLAYLYRSQREYFKTRENTVYGTKFT